MPCHCTVHAVQTYARDIVQAGDLPLRPWNVRPSTMTPDEARRPSRGALSGATSLYLDGWRLSAATVVFVGHVAGQRFTGGLFWQIEPYTGQAVTVFFVLSGFVIAYATDRGCDTARSYAVSRLARVYSVALPALVLTFILDAMGRAARPDLYTSAWGYVADGRAWQFFANLLLINQLWTLAVPPGSDLPYWSLGYEAWYYVIFGLAVFTPVRWRAFLVAATLLLVGPAITAMLPLWLLGWWGYRVCARGQVGRRAGWTMCVGSLLAWAAFELCGQTAVASLVHVPPILKRGSLVEDYVVAVLFIVHIIGFAAISPVFSKVASRLQKPVRWVAGATFTIYLLHLPIAQFLATRTPWPPAAWQTRMLLFGGTLLILFAVAEVTERRKTLWRQVFEGVLFRADRHRAIPDRG